MSIVGGVFQKLAITAALAFGVPIVPAVDTPSEIFRDRVAQLAELAALVAQEPARVEGPGASIDDSTPAGARLADQAIESAEFVLWQCEPDAASDDVSSQYLAGAPMFGDDLQSADPSPIDQSPELSDCILWQREFDAASEVVASQPLDEEPAVDDEPTVDDESTIDDELQAAAPSLTDQSLDLSDCMLWQCEPDAASDDVAAQYLAGAPMFADDLQATDPSLIDQSLELSDCILWQREFDAASDAAASQPLDDELTIDDEPTVDDEPTIDDESTVDDELPAATPSLSDQSLELSDCMLWQCEPDAASDEDQTQLDGATLLDLESPDAAWSAGLPDATATSGAEASGAEASGAEASGAEASGAEASEAGDDSAAAGKIGVSVSLVVAVALAQLKTNGEQSTPQVAACQTAAACVSIPRPEDEIWLIGSRCLGCCWYPTNGPALLYWRHNQAQGWVPATADEFWSTLPPDMHVCVAIHGNRMTPPKAVAYGWSIYGAAVRNAPTQQPMRFVIWSWPSEKAHGGPTNDALVKAARADVDSRFLAWFIDRLAPQAPLSLTGYSFGARVIGGALQLVAGGAINGYAMPAGNSQQPRFARVVLMASAIDNDWLLPGRRYGLAMGQMEHLTLINNSCDRVLRSYHRLYSRHGGPQALGCTGQAAPQWLGPDLAKLEQHDVCCMIGPRHDWERYMMNGAIVYWLSAGLAPTARMPLASAAPASLAPEVEHLQSVPSHGSLAVKVADGVPAKRNATATTAATKVAPRSTPAAMRQASIGRRFARLPLLAASPLRIRQIR